MIEGPIKFTELVRGALDRLDKLPPQHKLKTVACTDCLDRGRVGVMRQRHSKVRGEYWEPIWLACTCKARDPVSEDLIAAVERWRRPDQRPHHVVMFQGEIAILNDDQCWILEHAMNGIVMRNPLHGERPWSAYESMRWAIGTYIPQEWADEYEAGRTVEERVDEFFS